MWHQHHQPTSLRTCTSSSLALARVSAAWACQKRPVQLTETLARSTDKARPAPTASFVGQLCGPITLTTRSLQPLVFLVEPLLTHAECAHVINITTPMLVDSDVTLFDSDRAPPPPPPMLP